MTLSQRFLRGEFDRRVRLAHRGPRPSDETPPGGARPADAPLTAVVMRNFAVQPWIRATVAFALTVPPERAARWQRAFTRTVFLAGNPANLAARYRFDHVADDGSAAWLGPRPEAESAALRRLLKLYTAPRPFGDVAPGPAAVAVPGPPSGRVLGLHVATVGITVSTGLVHLNHLLVEAVFDGAVGAGDLLLPRFAPRLTGLRPPYAALRVGPDPEVPHRLRAFACLSEEEVIRGAVGLPRFAHTD
ncbi:hypothetical protein IOD16_14740 [Saccharothrix sp. 6-C]|uniref:DUF6182 family protein n=1 Tax=Saccharothrix sp. 6-C TaxID=2781735 RepID=UPI0019179D8B|nr:DUF6182 family protein [Saccharothrix sp. 6-C]QQQ79540.1 hypothetical protein IOD16_14740 [Saccharothrix sp. 6-C]